MRAAALTTAVFGLFLVGSVVPAAGVAEQKETERFSRTVPLAPGGTLKLKSFSGKVAIVGAEQREVSIEAVRRATRDRLDRIKLDVQSSGSSSRLSEQHDDSWFSRHKNNNVVGPTEIKVPSKTNLDSRSSAAV
jgi:hypothetical protein